MDDFVYYTPIHPSIYLSGWYNSISCLWVLYVRIHIRSFYLIRIFILNLKMCFETHKFRFDCPSSEKSLEKSSKIIYKKNSINCESSNLNVSPKSNQFIDICVVISTNKVFPIVSFFSYKINRTIFKLNCRTYIVGCSNCFEFKASN